MEAPMLFTRRLASSLLVLGTFLSACVAPTTQFSGLSPEQIKEEQLKQQQLVIKSEIKDQRRMEDVGHGLLKAALPICGASAAAPRAGVRFANLYTFNKDYRNAARALGLGDTLSVVSVARGSAAEKAGVTVGDRIVGVGEQVAPTGATAVKNAAEQLARLQARGPQVRLTLLPGSPDLASTTPYAQAPGVTTSKFVEVRGDTVCSYGLVAVKEDMLNAFADGKNVYVTSAMLRFAADDAELQVVIAHEIGHNAMKHMDAKKRNAGLGALFGAVLDVAAASQGVNTGGEFTNDFAAIGAQVFSQDFEREADYVGMYILARAGLPIASAPDFWRRMGQESPGSIKFASSHPTTAERFVRLEAAVKEIEAKRSAGKPLLPEVKQ